MRKNWKTTLGGAISITGTSLIGIGTLTQLTQLSPSSNIIPSKVLTLLWYIAAAGFVLSAIGKGITAWTAADASSVTEVSDRVDSMTKTVDTMSQSNQNQPTTPPQT